ncbi:hypothetical protein ETAA8_04830 [Anatilimnocola aggregata]|uniref:Uncharacterized protein n=1 Tax=Anatilimnocola aggregata TaxID=2528021 RepID=A0A517Y5A9_9BACT|nr:hypothetical protein [Anatilimnocola aggregata]QDU25415.1 hypothetical protein ETAA8_04830 [Anatilimnocola aggregata]
MPTNSQIIDALKRAAEALKGQTLTQNELDSVIDEYNRTSGTHRQKSRKAMKTGTGLTDDQIEKRASASDDVDRKIRDLEGLLND